ncbi:SCP-like protein [Ancylostoma ceylanicum]|uniref:SCP-like protein n=1 Tax=Ancylostoma ceylanicum TaxID=53326 RepID=A0A0D6LQR6_9BILA|nr:SCP-like protein [Ancylostoma ceylanicum]
MASVPILTSSALLLFICSAAAAPTCKFCKSPVFSYEDLHSFAAFGCDGKISDVMRRKILDFHNQARVKLANGQEKNKTGRLPSAKNMYKLSWDCELEKKAQAAIANCPEDLSDLQGYGTNFGKMYYCPKYPKPSEVLVMNELSRWWNEARKYGLTDSKNRYIKEDMQGSMEEWANMANGKNTKIGCSYNKIRSSTVFLCAYDDNAEKDEKVIYESGKPCKKDQDCTTYQGSKCGGSGLCLGTPEPGYKQKEEALERACNDKTGMNEEIRKHLLDSYNKYRSRVARGLEPDAAGGNAPKAEQMLKMIYDCPTEKVAFKLAKKCPSATRKIYSHNWNMHKASNRSMSDEAAADEMAKDISYKLGCVIHTCNDGKYVHCLSSPTGPQPVNKPIYQVGEPCKKNSDCKGKFVCSVDEGLCSLF